MFHYSRPHLAFLLSTVLAPAFGSPLSSSTTATTTATTTTPSPSCTAPPTPTDRPKCSSSGSDTFLLQLARCNHPSTDNHYLIPVSKSPKTGHDNVFTSTSKPESRNLYAYPSGFTYGPWAWAGEFAGGVRNATAGLDAVTFGEGSQYNCALTGDLVPFQCGGVDVWYVQEATGELFAAAAGIQAPGGNGYVKVVPYIIQGCHA